MLKPVLICFFILLLLLVLVNQYTTVRLFPVKAPVDYSAYPFLKDAPAAAGYRLKKLDTDIYAEITYHPQHNFFLVRHREGIIKIDAAGREVFRYRGDPHQFPHFIPYLFDTTGVTDLSAEKPVKQPFCRIINVDDTMDNAACVQLFKQHYTANTVVIYGEEQDEKGVPVYFHTDSTWEVLYLRPLESGMTYMEERYNRGFAGYPPKFTPMYLLKDAEHDVYADLETSTGTMLQEYDTLIRQAMQVAYPDNRIHLLGARKLSVFTHAAYLPVYPTAFKMDAAYTITVHNNSIPFRAYATKKTGFSGKYESYLLWFQVPGIFQAQTSISFLRYSFPVMGDENSGIYVITGK